MKSISSYGGWVVSGTLDIDSMAAATSMDLLVAEKVMGWRIFDPPYHNHDEYLTHVCKRSEFGRTYLEIHRPLNNEVRGWSYGDTWSPSVYIADAFEVVEKLELTVGKLPGIPEWAVAKIERSGELGDIWKLKTLAIAPSAPLAISRAALKIVLCFPNS